MSGSVQWTEITSLVDYTICGPQIKLVLDGPCWSVAAENKKKIPKIPTDGWLSQHQLGFLFPPCCPVQVLSCALFSSCIFIWTNKDDDDDDLFANLETEGISHSSCVIELGKVSKSLWDFAQRLSPSCARFLSTLTSTSVAQLRADLFATDMV